jgi:hypothetical protein
VLYEIKKEERSRKENGKRNVKKKLIKYFIICEADFDRCNFI